MSVEYTALETTIDPNYPNAVQARAEYLRAGHLHDGMEIADGDRSCFLNPNVAVLPPLRRDERILGLAELVIDLAKPSRVKPHRGVAKNPVDFLVLSNKDHRAAWKLITTGCVTD